jgi:hypothetical protein
LNLVTAQNTEMINIKLSKVGLYVKGECFCGFLT